MTRSLSRLRRGFGWILSFQTQIPRRRNPRPSAGLRLAIALITSMTGHALSARMAHADSGMGTRLQYARSQSATSCPAEPELRRAVRQRLGYDPFFAAARQTIVVEIVDKAGRLVGRVRLVDAEGIIRGDRELSENHDHCAELVASLALAISITLDPAAALTDQASAGAPEPSVQPQTTAAPSEAGDVPASEAPEINASHDASFRLREDRRPAVRAQQVSQASEVNILPSLRAGTMGALGVVPNATFGARLGAALRSRGFRLILDAFGTLPGTETSDLGGSVRLQLLGVSLTPCLAIEWFSACGLFTAGNWHAWSEGVALDRNEHLFHLGLGGRVEAALAIAERWSLSFTGDLARTLTPISLRLHSEEVWASSTLSTSLGIGVELHFR